MVSKTNSKIAESIKRLAGFSVDVEKIEVKVNCRRFAAYKAPPANSARFSKIV